jgi:hypothetical protein
VPDDEPARHQTAERSTAGPGIRAFDDVLAITEREYRPATGLAKAMDNERRDRADERAEFEESRRQAKARGGTVYR